MPKDSIGVIELGKEEVWKRERVLNYKTPQQSAGWMAYQLEKSAEAPPKSKTADNKSTNKTADSLNGILQTEVESGGYGEKWKNEGDSSKDSFTANYVLYAY